MKYFLAIIMLFSTIYLSKCFGAVDYEKLANKITNQTIKHLSTEKNLLCIGRGGGMMGLLWHKLLAFHYYRPVTLEEARNLIIYATESYRKDINASKEIRSYLIEYPFPPSRFNMAIYFFKDRSLATVEYDQITYVSVNDEIIEYILGHEAKQSIAHRETYAEALKIVQEKQAATSIGAIQ